MKVSPKEDRKKHLRFIAEYEDGTTEMFVVLKATLDQGPGKMGIVRIIAGEWQRGGHLKPGKILAVRRPSADEMIQMDGKEGA